MHVVAGASPSLLKAVGSPKHPEDLRHLPCIIDVNLQGQSNWRFIEDGKTISVPVNGPVRVNSPLAARKAAEMGLGFVVLAVLPRRPGSGAWRAGAGAGWLPSHRTDAASRLSAPSAPGGKVRALIDHLVDWFTSHPIK